jgi:choline dehydrogenase-like flavoprotein
MATGVSYLKGGVSYTPTARKEVIISAGSMQSPKLLELSGIGDYRFLNKYGIECLVNNPNVGENFQNHLMLPLG